MQNEKDFGKFAKKLTVKGEETQPIPAEVKKAHANVQTSQVNQNAKLDRDYEFATGVSPIRFRHEIDLYGTKIGVGKFNPIMVENLHRFPDPEEYQHGVMNKDKQNKEKEKEKTP